jgi:hypothetical protein
MLNRGGNPMKLRGSIFLIAAMLARAYVFWWMNRFCKPGGAWDTCYELGSVAWPYPTSLGAALLFAPVSALIGLLLLGFDFIQWRRSLRKIRRKANRTLDL